MNTQPIFIQVGDLAEGFAPDSHILPAVSDFAGQTLRLHFADGSVIEHVFETASDLNWTVVAGAEAGQSGVDSYRATSVREGIYFIDFIKQSARATTVSLVIDNKRGLFTAVIGTLPSEAETRLDAFSRVEQGLELTAVKAVFAHGTINRPVTLGEELHQPTRELIGLRNLYTYSPTERYEHIYLNENFYAWQCLDGVEKGLADVDRCHYIKIDSNLYLFVWREKIIPTLGVVMIDLDRLKTDGKIFGYQGNNFNELSNFPVGALAEVLNTTRYPQD
ncbi:molybdenum cofactor biosynthesis F family protein [Pseudogulbenkiania ferrooxidans]|uniref:MoaF n=1 Tax=Pseudogulbenkiania ferrooxidans 2002 TaxID=279714 RepID=B9Z426_9NEIS|nr:molybdenum cofactor biosynthesis F family protein [Pseudogulbenkiania ferrooxidans]EEG08603.1 MoaF [Pseudogulbenkiania ferrooxidans 2002]